LCLLFAVLRDSRSSRYPSPIEPLPSPAILEFGILGPLEVVGDQGRIPLGGPRQRATLAILLLSANRVVSVERLADDLYAGAAPVTAVTQVQRQISELRRALGTPSVIETRSPGYVIRLSREQLDLHRFERLTEEAGRALSDGEAGVAARLLREALRLWRGAPLADFAYESFAQAASERLEEIRLAALAQQIDAELALGHHGQLIGQLEQLVGERPFHELFRAQLMIALYRSGRQAEALEVYRKARAALVEEFGIEPTRALRELERAILAQDRSLELGEAAEIGVRSPRDSDRALLVVAWEEDRLDELLRIAGPLARLPDRELILVHMVEREGELGRAAAVVNACRAAHDVKARTAAFTTSERAGDVVRMATTYDVDVVLLDAPAGIDAHRLPDELAAILERSPADVAVLVGAAVDFAAGDGVYVPFAGGEHDWAALELGASLASAAGAPLRLVGTKADAARGHRDASRLLADASLAVQRVVGVETYPVLAVPTRESLVTAVEQAALVVVGLSPRWRREGIGVARRALVRKARVPILLLHAGPRPGGLAPAGNKTRFTWSLEPEAV
jgi:DNA-binding SARP family transcriptional activator